MMSEATPKARIVGCVQVSIDLKSSICSVVIACLYVAGCDKAADSKTETKPIETKVTKPSEPMSEAEAAKTKPVPVKNYSKEVSLQGVTFRI